MYLIWGRYNSIRSQFSMFKFVTGSAQPYDVRPELLGIPFMVMSLKPIADNSATRTNAFLFHLSGCIACSLLFRVCSGVLLYATQSVNSTVRCLGILLGIGVAALSAAGFEYAPAFINSERFGWLKDVAFGAGSVGRYLRHFRSSVDRLCSDLA